MFRLVMRDLMQQKSERRSPPSSRSGVLLLAVLLAPFALAASPPYHAGYVWEDCRNLPGLICDARQRLWRGDGWINASLSITGYCPSCYSLVGMVSYVDAPAGTSKLDVRAIYRINDISGEVLPASIPGANSGSVVISATTGVNMSGLIGWDNAPTYLYRHGAGVAPGTVVEHTAAFDKGPGMHRVAAMLVIKGQGAYMRGHVDATVERIDVTFRSDQETLAPVTLMPDPAP